MDNNEITAEGFQKHPSFTRSFVSDNRLSRRSFLKVLAVTGTAVLATGCVPKKDSAYHMQTPLKDNEDVENNYLILHDEEDVPLSQFEVQWVPDGHIPFVTFSQDKVTYFISGNAATFAFLKDKNGNLISRDRDKNGHTIPCYGKDPSEVYRNGYGTITSILQLDEVNPDHIFGITHNEQWKASNIYENYTGSIGLVESKDQGKTWESHGQIIKATDALLPGEKVTGVGQPCAIIKEENGEKYVYVYYLYLPSKEGAPYLIHLSRAQITNAKIGEFEHYTKDGFKKGINITPDTIMPVIQPPKNMESYTALPSISYNAGRKRFEAVFETQFGFCASTSTDGIHWLEPELIFKFPNGQYPHFNGQKWYSNPTFWSPDENSDQKTNNNGYLIYSKGIWPNPHSMKRRRFELK
ncbi:MAG: twin-arginine translocation signal domain-containing protein [Candidatus Levybacteria bacterium]|nr:twin-arginine translocation signal domain-containing protein [Candidatus Levybacteria bacterium]